MSKDWKKIIEKATDKLKNVKKPEIPSDFKEKIGSTKKQIEDQLSEKINENKKKLEEAQEEASKKISS